MYDDKLDKVIEPPLSVTVPILAEEIKSMEEIIIMQPESSYPVNIGIGNQEDGTTIDTGSWMAKTRLVIQRVSQDGHTKETTTYPWLGGEPTTRYEEWLSCTTNGKRHLWKAKPMNGGEANEMEVRAGTKMDRVLGCIYKYYQLKDSIRHGDFQDSCGWTNQEYFIRDKDKYKTKRCIIRNYLATITRKLGIIVEEVPGGFRFKRPTDTTGTWA